MALQTRSGTRSDFEGTAALTWLREKHPESPHRPQSTRFMVQGGP